MIYNDRIFSSLEKRRSSGCTKLRCLFLANHAGSNNSQIGLHYLGKLRCKSELRWECRYVDLSCANMAKPVLHGQCRIREYLASDAVSDPFEFKLTVSLGSHVLVVRFFGGVADLELTRPGLQACSSCPSNPHLILTFAAIRDMHWSTLMLRRWLILRECHSRLCVAADITFIGRS